MNTVIDSSARTVTADVKANSITTFIISEIASEEENSVADDAVEDVSAETDSKEDLSLPETAAPTSHPGRIAGMILAVVAVVLGLTYIIVKKIKKNRT